jgi:hydroxyacylglutathione hydrolase
LNPDQDLDEAIRQLTRVGLDDIRGVISRLADWEAPLQSYRLANTHEFAAAIRDGAQVLDARAPNEWELGTIAGSTLAYAPDVVSEIPPDLEREREVWVACGTGYRANLAASCLRNRGFEPVVLAEAGILDVLKALEDVPGDN